MSDHRAIGSVSATLKYLIQAWVTHDLGVSVNVVLTRPDTATATSTPTLSLFLYQVSPNPQLRQDELPTRRADGTLSGRPRLPLDLHYLLSVYGGESALHPQVLLGSALRALHTFPVLTRDLVAAALADEIGGSDTHPLYDSDLARQVELVRLTPLRLDLEELSKLWSVMLQAPYAVSAAFQAGAVLIDAATAPTPALPVRAVQLFTLPKPIIVLESVQSTLGRDEPITAESSLLLRGRGLRGDTTRVRVAGVEGVPASASPLEIRFDLATLPAGALRAGVQPVSVVHHPTADDGTALDYGFESNALGFALRPTITVSTSSPPSTSELTLEVSPAIERRQRVVLYLYGAQSFAFEATIDAETADELVVRLGDGVPAGDYLVRLQVDGAQSVLETDSSGAFTGPSVSLS